jgi:hypothetical protein
MDVDMDDAPVKISPSTMRENMVIQKHNGFSTDRLYSPSFISNNRSEYSYRVMAIDPSGRGADETGVAIGFTLGGRIHFKKITGIQGGYDIEVLDQLVQMCIDHRVDYLVIESNFGDGAFAKMLEPILYRRSPNTKLDEVRAKGRKEIRIISTLEPLLNQRRIVIDKRVLDDDLKADAVNSFTHQLTRITQEPNSLRHDDRIDAVEMLCKFVMDKEDFDEESASERFDASKLEEDLEKFFKTFGMDDFQGNSNYGDRY